MKESIIEVFCVYQYIELIQFNDITAYKNDNSFGLTCDTGSEGAPRNVLVIVTHQDVVVTRQRGKVSDRTGAIFIVHTAYFSFGGTLNS